MPEKICKVEVCDGSAKRRGYCYAHYARERAGMEVNVPIARNLPRNGRTCSVPGCNLPPHARGMCDSHYSRDRRGVETESLIGEMVKPTRLCDIEGCERKHVSKGYCATHLNRAKEGRQVDAPIEVRRSRLGRDCIVDGCEGKIDYKDMCSNHAKRFVAGGDVNKPVRRWRIAVGEWGNWIMSRHGYILRYGPKPNPGEARPYQFQHRYVMEQHLGRELKKHENVHHVNGIRDDNRIENLELWSVMQPSGQRVADRIEWAKSLLEEYEFVVTRPESAGPLPERHPDSGKIQA